MHFVTHSQEVKLIQHNIKENIDILVSVGQEIKKDQPLCAGKRYSKEYLEFHKYRLVHSNARYGAATGFFWK